MEWKTVAATEPTLSEETNVFTRGAEYRDIFNMFFGETLFNNPIVSDVTRIYNIHQIFLKW